MEEPSHPAGPARIGAQVGAAIGAEEGHNGIVDRGVVGGLIGGVVGGLVGGVAGGSHQAGWPECRRIGLMTASMPPLAEWLNGK